MLNQQTTRRDTLKTTAAIAVSGLSSQNLVAFADGDDKRAAGAYRKYPNAKKYRDYRKMFDDLGTQLDVVIISTPDHMYFHPAYAAWQSDFSLFTRAIA